MPSEEVSPQVNQYLFPIIALSFASNFLLFKDYLKNLLKPLSIITILPNYFELFIKNTNPVVIYKAATIVNIPSNIHPTERVK
jgi:hypothetical protein